MRNLIIELCLLLIVVVSTSIYACFTLDFIGNESTYSENSKLDSQHEVLLDEISEAVHENEIMHGIKHNQPVLCDLGILNCETDGNQTTYEVRHYRNNGAKKVNFDH